VQESRPVRAASPPLTRGALLQLITPEEERLAASRVIEQLEVLGFDHQKATSSFLNFGFTDNNGDSHFLACLGQGGVWTYPLKRDRDLLGADAVIDFHKRANKFGRFYREDQMDKLDSTGCQVRYRQLEDSAAGFAAFLDSYRVKIEGLLKLD